MQAIDPPKARAQVTILRMASVPEGSAMVQSYCQTQKLAAACSSSLAPQRPQNRILRTHQSAMIRSCSK